MIQYCYELGQTPIDDDEKTALIPNIVCREDLDTFEQENIIEAYRWVMDDKILARNELFSETFLLKLHKQMFQHVWKWAGQYRKSNKNIGVEYYHIPIELHKLLEDAKFWIENQTYPLIDLAIIFHHRLVKIHLFPNGNGRHARLAADAIATKYKCQRLSWGKNQDLSKPEKIRKNYITALREADKGNYSPLILFAKS